MRLEPASSLLSSSVPSFHSFLSILSFFPWLINIAIIKHLLQAKQWKTDKGTKQIGEGAVQGPKNTEEGSQISNQVMFYLVQALCPWGSISHTFPAFMPSTQSYGSLLRASSHSVFVAVPGRVSYTDCPPKCSAEWMQRLARYNSQLCHIPAVCPWASDLTSLSINVFTWKLGMSVKPLSWGFCKTQW